MMTTSNEHNNAPAVPQGWAIRHIDGGISVTHKDGSGAFVRETETSERIIPAEILYRLCSDLIAVAPQPEPNVPRGFATLNEWFLSLPEQRQAQLRDDKWMLANAAFMANRTAAPSQPAVPQGWKLVQTPITEEMHVAAVKVLHRAPGLAGLPQRMLDAMLATTPATAPDQGKWTLCRDDAIRIWHRNCDKFSDALGNAPPSPVIDAMLAFAHVASALAAPELLAALENLRAEAVRYLPNYNEHSAIQDADEVIVKFTGEQP